MNSYFDQQWDQQLAGRPQALAAFTRLSPPHRNALWAMCKAAITPTRHPAASAGCWRSWRQANTRRPRNNPHKKAAAESLFAFLGSFLLIYWRPASL